MQRLPSSVLHPLFFLAPCLVSTLPIMTCAAQFDAGPAWTSGGDQTPQDELSPLQEQIMWRDIQHNIALLKSQSLLAEPDATQSVTYNFPLRLAPGLPDYAGFRVSASITTVARERMTVIAAPTLRCGRSVGTRSMPATCR
jgi:hypothetical protein